MRVYPSRNALATEQFINEVLKYCEGKPMFIVDNAPLIESAYSSFKLKYSSTTSNPINRSERFGRSMACWNLTI